MNTCKGSAKLYGTAIYCAALSLPSLSMAQEMPVYQVVDRGISEDQAYQLSKNLGISPELINLDLLRSTGELSYIDIQRHQYIPTRIIGKGEPDEERKATLVEQLDLEALADIKPVDGDTALHQLQQALKAAELLPESYQPSIQHTRFDAVDTKGYPLVNALIDTKVSLQSYTADIPLIGPGAKISMSIAADGNATRLSHANWVVEKGEYVSVIDHSEAQYRCQQRLSDSYPEMKLEDLNISSNLVYYAPPLELDGVKTIQPHYDCGGTAVIGGEIVHLLHELIPAVDSIEYVPSIVLEAKSDGKAVVANVDIAGGLPPYSLEWGAGSVKALDRAGTTVTYQPEPREGIADEVVTVRVTDANGIESLATARVGMAVAANGGSAPISRALNSAITSLLQQLVPAAQAVGGITDYGTENAVTNQFGDLEQGFIDRMQSAGVTERFSWSGTNAWEQDFKAPEDSNWIDNTDMTFYVGHGNGGGFTFENTTHDDYILDYDDADDDWGDKDLEWLALLSCQVLKYEWSGMTRFERWSQEFDGLHLLLGFHTSAYAWSSFSGEFADNMLKNNPMTVRTAWFEATDTDQPNGVVPVVMGVMDQNGMANVNDYFWGKGPVGPDVRDGDIAGYWSITMY